MDWKNQLTKTPVLVLFIVLITIGVGTASALITITFEGLTVFKENSQFDKDVNIDGTITGFSNAIYGVVNLNYPYDIRDGPAGIDCIIVENAFTSAHDFTSAKMVLKSLSELIKILIH